ncbi:MAG TPA: hypothetical protein VK629_12515 [Steroidobacteraceae bacterium]|nr:hypothetical protein [Steroidobacteraceae bacterium]
MKRKAPSKETTILGDEESRQRVDAFLLATYAKCYAGGDKEYLMSGIMLCVEAGYALPDWVRQGLEDGHRAIKVGKAKSWDLVFGKAKPVASRNRKWKVANQVKLGVLNAKHDGRAIDDGLFDEIGESIGVSGSLAKLRYYEFFPPDRKETDF